MVDIEPLDSTLVGRPHRMSVGHEEVGRTWDDKRRPGSLANRRERGLGLGAEGARKPDQGQDEQPTCR
jgi:hypothetical protein